MFDSFRSRFAAAQRDNQLFFAALLKEQTIRSLFGEASAILGSAQVYNTAITLWVFLSQTLSADHGCVSAIAKLIAFRAAKGQSIPSSNTGAYCIARDKLDEQSMHRVVTQTGSDIEESAPDEWLWLGHRVIMGDGTTVTMADTPENQAAYPQLSAQKPGCGFPIMRMVVLFALSTGTVLDAAMGRYKGKLTAEVSLFREIDSIIQENDVYLADRAFSGWFDVARLAARGAQVVVRKHQRRNTDFRTGIRYGKDDHGVVWGKPDKPSWMSQDEYETYPSILTLREIRIRVETPGFRTREIIIVTTLLDHIEYTKDDLAALFRRRWQAELNLRSLKTVMQMEHLRCKKPHRVRNEIRAHFAAYNLIRQVMCEAAIRGGVCPWQISFKATMQTLNEMLPILGSANDPNLLWDIMLVCCLKHVVGNRQDRFEPRVLKRRPKPYKLMVKPRREYQPGEA